MNWVTTGLEFVRRHWQRVGPYLLVELLLPGGSLLALCLFLGGLFTFLVVEKIQGKPLSAKTQSIAQVVGLAIILSVFLLVTYQDIARMVL